MSETSNFEFNLSRSTSFSDASRIAQIALDPDLVGQVSGQDEYPPVLTPRIVGSQYYVRSDDGFRATSDEEKVTKYAQAKLVHWASEGFFEIVPLPHNTASDNVGFRITKTGIEAAQVALGRQSARLISLARVANKHLGIIKD